MYTIHKYFKISFCLVFFVIFTMSASFSQDFELDNQESELVVSGTSSLHDWHITAEKQKGHMAISQSDQVKVDELKVEINSESLESGRNAMDKNTYKALKTDDFKYIVFQLTETKELSKMDNGNYKVKCYGNLTVAGTTKKINLDFKMNLSSNKVVLTGEKTIKMTDYNIDPPKALLGTITTGDEITITFKTVLSK